MQLTQRQKEILLETPKAIVQSEMTKEEWSACTGIDLNAPLADELFEASMAVAGPLDVDDGEIQERLDDLVADFCDSVGAEAANSAQDGEAEDVIASWEETRAEVNNKGMAGQLIWLIEMGDFDWDEAFPSPYEDEAEMEMA